MENKILNKYYDYENPGSFSGLRSFLKNNKIKKSQAKDVLSSTEPYTFHKKAINKFKRSHFKADYVDHIWQVDLLDFRNLKNKKFAQWYGYIFVCIDVLSKYAWVEAIENKSAHNSKIALKNILEKSNRKPKIIYSDKGSEFLGEYQSFLDKLQIDQQFTNSKFKASVAERFIRTLKEKLFRVFTYRKQTKYIDILQKIVKNYNNSYHTSIGTTPAKVNKDNEKEIYKRLYGDSESLDNYIEFDFKVGDYVRIKIEKDFFEKGYTQKWTTEIFCIDSQIPSNPPKYTIKKLDVESKTVLSNFYYTEELQKVTIKEFPYDTFEVIDENNSHLKVKQLNNEEQKETWIPKKKAYKPRVKKYNLRTREVTTEKYNLRSKNK